jgi:hypothetical protein
MESVKKYLQIRAKSDCRMTSTATYDQYLSCLHKYKCRFTLSPLPKAADSLKILLNSVAVRF